MADRIGYGCFSGRDNELIALTGWMNRDEDGAIRLVTGSAGVGKSALIGVLVCAAHPVLRRPTKLLWDRVARVPAQIPHIAAVHARQRGIAEITESGAPVCRLLAGVRSDPEFSRLRALAVSEHGLIDLDDVSDDRLLRDLEEYVDKLLKSQPPYDQRMHAPARAAFAAAVAEALVSRRAGRRWGEFLVAALYTHHLLTTHDPIVDSRVAETLGLRAPSELREVLELDLLRRNNVSFLRPVLAVLAHALGEGMPASLIRAVTPLFAANRHPSADEITAALEAARFYLRCTADTDGTVVYRLFHQGLADYLRDHPVSPDIPAVPTAIAQGILSHILRTLSAPGENVELAPRQWAFAEPYLLRHALQHAVTAGRPALVAGDPEFLVCADPSILVLFFSGTSVPEELIPVAEIYLSSVGKPENLGSNDRRQALAVAAAAHGLADLARRLASPPGQPPLAWQPLWAMTRRLSANVEGGFVPVKIATVADLLSGPAIIAVTRDGASSSWDLATGKHLNRWRGFYPDGELKEVRIGGQTTILASSAGAPRHSCPRPAGRDDNSGVTRPSGGCRRRRYIRFPANRQPRRIAFMTRILGIHGIGNFQAGLPPEAAGQLLGQRWEAALPHAAAAGVIDVRVAYYAHCLGPARAQGSDELAHLTPSAEQFVMAWVKALGAPAEIAQGRVGAPVRQAADWIAARYGLDRRSVHLLIARFAAEVDRYINLSDCRVRARQAVTTQLLDYSPQVVIAHSLGSVVAYEALFEMTPHPIDLLITIGSPIGTFRFHSAAAYLGCSAMAGLLAAYLDPA